MENSDEAIECAVCLQPSIHPVQLPCSHIFCFLCVKGVTIQSQRCPMCRREIPQSYLEHPTLLKQPESLADAKESSSESKKEDSEDDETEPEYRWFYQGRNGWWEYDERTAQELEHHHKKGDKSCELLIAGFLYSIDFENMLQCRRNEPQRRRQIKRDLITNVADKKGIAGIRTAQNTNANVDDLATRMSNVQIATTSATSDTTASSSNTTTTRATLQDLVDLGAASSGANIAIRNTGDDHEDENDDDDDDDDSNVV